MYVCDCTSVCVSTSEHVGGGCVCGGVVRTNVIVCEYMGGVCGLCVRVYVCDCVCASVCLWEVCV